MKNFMIKYAVVLLLLTAALLSGCTKGAEAVSDITEDDLYILYAGTKDSDGQPHEFIYHKGEIFEVTRPNIGSPYFGFGDKVFVIDRIPYVFFKKYYVYGYEYENPYFREDELVNFIDGQYITDVKVYNGKYYACGWNSDGHKNWIDGVPHETVYQGGNLVTLTTDGINIYHLYEHSSDNFNDSYKIYKNDEFLYDLDGFNYVSDITYADGHLYACGRKDGKGAIWRDGEIWKTDPINYYSDFQRIKVLDGNVYTKGFIYDEYERTINTLFQNAFSMIQVDLGDEIIDFEITKDAAYIFANNFENPKDYFIKVNLHTGTKSDVYLPNANNIGFHDIYPVSASIDYTYEEN